MSEHWIVAMVPLNQVNRLGDEHWPGVVELELSWSAAHA